MVIWQTTDPLVFRPVLLYRQVGTHSLAHTCARALFSSLTDTHTRTSIHVLTQIHTHRTNKHTHEQTQKHTRARTHTHTHTRSHTHTRTHICTDTQTQTHTRTHTHTLSHSFCDSCQPVEFTALVRGYCSNTEFFQMLSKKMSSVISETKGNKVFQSNLRPHSKGVKVTSSLKHSPPALFSMWRVARAH